MAKINSSKHITRSGTIKNNPLPKRVRNVIYNSVWHVNVMERDRDYQRREMVVFLRQNFKRDYTDRAVYLFDKHTELEPDKRYKTVSVDFLANGAGRLTYYDVTPNEAKQMTMDDLNDPNHTFYNEGKPIKSLRAYQRIDDPDELI